MATHSQQKIIDLTQAVIQEPAPATLMEVKQAKPTISYPDNCGNRFEFDRILGSGTFARVWSAHDRKFQQPVAVKHIIKATGEDTKASTDFQRQLQEYLFTKDLNHPNIVRVLDCIITEVDLLLVQEFAPGGDLFDLIVPDVGAPVQASLKILNQLTAALVYLTKVGIVHRDIKPENIVRDLEGNIKLCDFGMAERTGTLVRGARGTIAYLAPDLLQRRKDISQKYPVAPSTDMWGLGLIFYALLVGAHPWTKADPTERYYNAYLTKGHFRAYPWKLFPSGLHVIFNRLFEPIPTERCSLAEFQAFLDTQWTSTVPVLRDRITVMRANLNKTVAPKSSLV